jgi:uncharacterized membrane protein
MTKLPRCSILLRLLLAGLLLLAGQQMAAAAPAKWTIFVYMLADNNLEPFALMDLEVSQLNICTKWCVVEAVALSAADCALHLQTAGHVHSNSKLASTSTVCHLNVLIMVESYLDRTCCKLRTL